MTSSNGAVAMRRTFDSYPVNLTTTGQLSVAGSYDGDRSMGVTALRGREREFESLVQAAENALAGSGTTVLLEGEAGIGKTRLLDEIATRAADLGMQVRRGAAEELEQGRPFGSLIDALGAPDTAPRLGHDTGAEAARALVQDAFVDHLEHLAASSLVLALDDLQWADRATMGTLWALARRSSDMGLLLVLAFRPTPSPPGFQRLLDGCDRIGAMHLRLGPVGDAVLDDLALEVLGAPPSPALRERLRGAGGNPFVAIELLASRSPDAPDVGHTEGDLTDTQLPPTLRAVLLARFTGLSDTARRVLPVAAVLGGSARVDDLASLLGITSDEATVVVTEAVDAGLFEPTGESLSFRHDLIREALYESLPDAVRLGWHREAARLLEGRAEPTVVAQHLMLGATRGDSDTIASLRRAAEQLRDKTPHVAASLLERALSLCQVPETRAEVALERALALLQAGRAAEAEHQAGDALAAGATGEVRARATFVRALALSYLDRFGEARAGFEAALASQELDPESRARALGLRATHCVYTLALDESLETAERAMAEGTRLGVPAAVIDALLARCIVHAMRSEFDAAIDAGRDAVALAETESSVVSTTSLLGMALQSSDRFDEARVVVEEGRRRASDRGEVSGFAIQQSELAFIAWATGRWDDALTELDALSGLVEDYGIRVGEALGQGVAGNIAFHRGDAATVRTVVEKASTEGIGGGLAPRLLLARLSALVQEAEGDIEGAASLLLASMDAGRAFGVDPPRNMIGIECARLAVAAGNIAATESLVAELDNYARRATTCSARGTAAYARGVSEGDGTLLCSAAQEFRAVGRPMLVLRAMESAGTAFAAAGARDSAVASLREAHRITNDLGAVFDRRRISAVLRDLGVRIGSKERVAQATDGWESLTTAERDVAELVGEGLRNGEIADRLFVSRRTIESHVSRLYTKLGIENRVALAQMTREHQTE